MGGINFDEMNRQQTAQKQVAEGRARAAQKSGAAVNLRKTVAVSVLLVLLLAALLALLRWNNQPGLAVRWDGTLYTVREDSAQYRVAALPADAAAVGTPVYTGGSAEPMEDGTANFQAVGDIYTAASEPGCIYADMGEQVLGAADGRQSGGATRYLVLKK